MNPQPEITAETRRILDLEEVRRIYTQHMRRDFAANELRPWASLKKSWDKKTYHCYGLYRESELLGYAFFLRLSGTEGAICLFDYLAITAGYRDRGLGSLFLRQLAEHISEDSACVLGEVEDPAAATDGDTRLLRQRRLDFYLRNGYLQTGVRVWLFGVDYQVLEVPVGQPHTALEIRSAYTQLYQTLLPPVFFRRWLRFKPDGFASDGQRTEE